MIPPGDLILIKLLTPFKQMSEQDVATVLARASIIDMPADRVLFKRQEKDANHYWLLAGGLDLVDDRYQVVHRQAEDENSNAPLDSHSPHRLTAVTTGPSRLLICEQASLSDRDWNIHEASHETSHETRHEIGAPNHNAPPDNKTPADDTASAIKQAAATEPLATGTKATGTKPLAAGAAPSAIGAAPSATGAAPAATAS